MMTKRSLLLIVPFLTLFINSVANAGNTSVVDIIHDIEIDGISLTSTAEDIESYISSQPSLACERVDVPQRKSMAPNRAPKPRYQYWSCVYAHNITPQNLKVQMSGGVITYLSFEKGYETPKSFNTVKNHFADINTRLKAAGLTSNQTNSKNFMTYTGGDVEGASSPTFTQQLRARATVMCDNLPVSYLVKLSANKTSSQNSNKVGMTIERSTHGLQCDAVTSL